MLRGKIVNNVSVAQLDQKLHFLAKLPSASKMRFDIENRKYLSQIDITFDRIDLQTRFAPFFHTKSNFLSNYVDKISKIPFKKSSKKL